MNTTSLNSLLMETISTRAEELGSQTWPELKDKKFFGAGALFDSLEFINFIVEIENKIQDSFQKKINLRQLILDKGMDVIKSPDHFLIFLEGEVRG